MARNCRTWTTLFIISAVILLLPNFCSGQYFCVTKCNDFKETNGFTKSSNCRVCEVCPDPPSCSSGLLEPPQSFLETPHPGIIVRQENGRTVVAKVLKGSPAVAAGVRPGGEIVRINGRSVLDSSGENQWSFAGNPVTLLTLRRGGSELVVSVKLVELRRLVENAWSGRIKSVALTPGMAPSADQPQTTFTVGVRTVRKRGQLVVAAILDEGPANRAGIRPGDEIVMLNGALASELTDRAVNDILGSDSEVALKMTLRRDGMQRDLVLCSEGLAHILGRMDSPYDLALGATAVAQAR